jgi:very-short-patch-repair endonuclease
VISMKDISLITTGYHIPYNPELKDRARELRKNMTEPEKKLWFNFLRNHTATFLRQKPLDNFIVDFYCAKYKLIIEIDGDSHYSEEGPLYDKRRTLALAGHGLHVLRFTNTEVMQNFEGVCEEVEKFLGKSEV